MTQRPAVSGDVARKICSDNMGKVFLGQGNRFRADGGRAIGQEHGGGRENKGRDHGGEVVQLRRDALKKGKRGFLPGGLPGDLFGDVPSRSPYSIHSRKLKL